MFTVLPVNLDLYLSSVGKSKDVFNVDLCNRLDRNGVKSPWIREVVANCEVLAEKGTFLGTSLIMSYIRLLEGYGKPVSWSRDIDRDMGAYRSKNSHRVCAWIKALRQNDAAVLSLWVLNNGPSPRKRKRKRNSGMYTHDLI